MEAQGLYLLKGDCQSPHRVTVLYMVYVFTMLVLFLDFKRRTYSKAKRAESGAVKKSVSTASMQETVAPSTDVDSASESTSSASETTEAKKTK
eukprot:TRINITY_DN75205_c0_g1_i1.p1 TRINITY_DN75205_c0_g1~~TRINITY_DN75205_c0_g1_i1.p1  ORF type:complete len:107 (-),score=20.64 TRINITY_DN75205_c0_g1_i1:66-344(-)